MECMVQRRNSGVSYANETVTAVCHYSRKAVGLVLGNTRLFVFVQINSDPEVLDLEHLWGNRQYRVGFIAWVYKAYTMPINIWQLGKFFPIEMLCLADSEMLAVK